MRRKRPALFKGRHFEAEIIVLCVRWYLRYPLSFRQLEEIMAERNLSAMQRNKTICGLSRAMVLIEARSTGGSIQAGRDCLKMGLPLFAAVYEGSPNRQLAMRNCYETERSD
jgi:hypothetical protein